MNTKAAKTIRELLIEKGLTPGSKEYRREYERERWHRRSPESKANCGQAGHAYVRARMERDPEYAAKMRARWKEQKIKQRQRRGDEINGQQRKNYKAKRDHHLAIIKEGRKRRNPAHGLHSLLRGVERGTVSPGDFARHARAAIDKFDSLRSGGSRKRLPGRRKGSSGKNSETVR